MLMLLLARTAAHHSGLLYVACVLSGTSAHCAAAFPKFPSFPSPAHQTIALPNAAFSATSQVFLPP